VESDRTAGFRSRHSRRADCIVRGDAIQISRQPTEGGMQVAVAELVFLPPALRDVATVTIKGMVVIKPIR
jgi:hypothetical protein